MLWPRITSGSTRCRRAASELSSARSLYATSVCRSRRLSWASVALRSSGSCVCGPTRGAVISVKKDDGVCLLVAPSTLTASCAIADSITTSCCWDRGFTTVFMDIDSTVNGGGAGWSDGTSRLSAPATSTSCLHQLRRAPRCAAPRTRSQPGPFICRCSSRFSTMRVLVPNTRWNVLPRTPASSADMSKRSLPRVSKCPTDMRKWRVSCCVGGGGGEDEWE